MPHLKFEYGVRGRRLIVEGEQAVVDDILAKHCPPLEAWFDEGVDLRAFLAYADASRRPTRRFLATVAWLQNRGFEPVRSGDVRRALADAGEPEIKSLMAYAAHAEDRGLLQLYQNREFALTRAGWSAVQSWRTDGS